MLPSSVREALQQSPGARRVGNAPLHHLAATQSFVQRLLRLPVVSRRKFTRLRSGRSTPLFNDEPSAVRDRPQQLLLYSVALSGLEWPALECSRHWKGPASIKSKHAMSTLAAEAFSTNSGTTRSRHVSIPDIPSRTWPPCATIIWRLAGKRVAVSAAQSGGVTGSMAPEMKRTGTSDSATSK